MFSQVPEREEQRERVHYLLSDAYPVYPVMPAPVMQPAATAQGLGSTFDLTDAGEVTDHVYVDMEGEFPRTKAARNQICCLYLKHSNLRIIMR